MHAPARTTGPELEVRVIEELLRTLVKGQRALQMYMPNNPVYQRALDQVIEAFAPVWGVTGRLTLDILEDEIHWDEMPVYRQPSRTEGLAWQLYKDGLRQLTLLPGVESDEIQRFLQVLNTARMLPADASDDLLTLLWEQEFVLISYSFVEVLGDGYEFIQESPVRDVIAPPHAARGEVADARATSAPQAPLTAGPPAGIVDLADYDATLYFLDDAEVRLVRSELDDEYRRDIRQAAIDALLDVLEGQRDPSVRREAVELLDNILPSQLATGGFRAVAHILRELRVIAARAPALEGELHTAVLSFEERLSQPDILEQLFRVLEDPATRPGLEDVADVLRELKPAALPTVLAHLGRITEPSVRSALETSVESLVRAQPQSLSSVLESGTGDALVPAIGYAGRLRLTQLVPAIASHLRGADENVRLAALQALAELGTPTAVAAVETALDDESRLVRQAALAALLQRGGSGGLARKLEALLFTDREQEWERSERRSLFEAFGQVAGAAAIPRLQELLEPRGVFRRREPPEIRACALFALGKVRTFDARLIVDRFTADKEPVVRSAANSILRDWLP